MEPVINEIISTLIQIGVFAFIPFIVFLFRKDKSVSFFRYVGLYQPSGKSLVYVLIASLFILVTGLGMVYIDEGVRQAVLAPASVTGKLRMMGFSLSTLIILLLIACFKTSLAEEIFFRGFVAKQLIERVGFKIGNILQAVFFGLVHLLLIMQLTDVTVVTSAVIFAFSSLAGWIIGYIKEKYANGSIISGWIGHATGNILSYFLISFVL